MRTISGVIRLLEGNDLKAKSARGVIALGIGTVAGRGTRFVMRMFLARILAPDQIGSMAIVISFSFAFETLTEVGVKQSIIQNKQGANTNYLNVAWWIQVIRGLCLFSIAALLAPWISSFYDNPELPNLLRVAFLAIVLRGFVSPRAHVLEKEYKFGRSVFLTQGSAVLGAIITVILAFVIRNVWALVFGFVAEMAILCILSFVFVPFLPTFRIDRKSVGELMKFARGMFGLPALTMLSFQAPVLILGTVIPLDRLGFYSYAAIFAYIPIDFYIRTVAPVVLPAFSEKQDDNRALCRGVLQTTKLTAVLFMPLTAFMACCSSELLLVYGPNYVAMAIPFAILCLQIVIRTETVSLAGIYLAVGQPHLLRRFAIIRAVAIIGIMYPAAARFGPLGAAVVIVLSNLAVLLLQILKAREVINLNMRLYLRSYFPGLVVALPIIITAILLRAFAVDSPLFILAVTALVFILSFAVSALIMSFPKETLQSQDKLRTS